MCALQLYCRVCVVHWSLSINWKHFRKFHSLKFGCHLKNKFTRVFLNLILLTLLHYIWICGWTAAVCGISLFLCIPLLMIVILIHSDRFNYNKKWNGNTFTSERNICFYFQLDKRMLVLILDNYILEVMHKEHANSDSCYVALG